MFAFLLSLTLMMGQAKPAPAATTQPAATSRPAIDVEFRPIRVIDHRERDLSKLFPPRRRPSDHSHNGNRGQAWVIRENVGEWFREGLTIRCKLSGSVDYDTMLIKQIRIDEVIPDEGAWPDAFRGAWVEGVKVGNLEERAEHIRFLRRSGFNGNDGVSANSVSVDLNFSRPPNGAKLFNLRGSMEFEVTTVSECAVDFDKAVLNERVKLPLLDRVGLSVKVVDPREVDHWRGTEDLWERRTAVEFVGRMDNLVEAYIAEAPVHDGELAGLQLEASTGHSDAPTHWGLGTKRILLWQTVRKRPPGARLVLRAVTDRRVESVPFSFEEIPLPK